MRGSGHYRVWEEEGAFEGCLSVIWSDSPEKDFDEILWKVSWVERFELQKDPKVFRRNLI